MKDAHVNPDVECDLTSSTLLDRMRSHEPQAWQRFVYLYSPLIYAWCRRAGLQEADAEDVGQEVFKAVNRSIGNFHHDQKGDTFRGWLRRITSSKISDHRRHNKPGHKGEGGSDVLDALAQLPAEESPSTDSVPEREERLLLLRRAVELLLADSEERTRQAFRRVVLEGQEVADVAQDLGMSRNAIYVARSRILGRLRAEFAQLVEVDELS